MSEADVQAGAREALQGPPSGYFIVVPDPQAQGSQALEALPRELLRAWKLLLVAAVIGALIALLLSLFMPPLYRAKALVAPVTQGLGNQASGLRQLSGLAGLAGIDLGTGGGRREEWFATLNSKSFAREFIQAANLLPVLYAERWDPRTGQWRADRKVPTLEEAVRRFTGEVVAISDDPKTTFVTVTVDWTSATLAAQWANGMVDLVNDKLRQDAVQNSQRSLEYLNKELEKTSVVEARQAIYHLIEQQLETAMVANVQRDYAYRLLDPAVAPEGKNSPKRALLGAAGAAIGLLLGIAVVLTRRGRQRPSGSSA